MNLKTKRVYEEAAPSDGRRVLIDRLWPRGLTKQAAQIDFWAKAVAPSNELRKWYQHDAGKWDEFRSRYGAELDALPESMAELRAQLQGESATLVFGSKEEQLNNATAMAEYLQAAPLQICLDDVSGREVIALLEDHLATVVLHSPPESVHALDLDGLRAADVTFWSAWSTDGLVGCGALKQLDAAHGEIKSMKTSPAHLRQGVAAALVEHLLGVARQRGYRRLSLETGSMQAFAPARSLYERFGFESTGPFADYVEDPNSVWMTRELSS